MRKLQIIIFILVFLLSLLSCANKSTVNNSIPIKVISENHIAITDLFALAFKGEVLTLKDLDTFIAEDYRNANKWIFDIDGAASLVVKVKDDKIESAEVISYRAIKNNQIVDLREGVAKLKDYLNPLRSFQDIKIEYVFDKNINIEELIYEDQDNKFLYIFNVDTKKVNCLNVIFPNGKRLPFTQALDEHYITIEDLLTNETTKDYRLTNIRMFPMDNPKEGEFVAMHHMMVFTFNQERFYPTKTFMYYAWKENVFYFDLDELALLLECFGHQTKADYLLQLANEVLLDYISERRYISILQLLAHSIEIEVIQYLSSRTPVQFTIN